MILSQRGLISKKSPSGLIHCNGDFVHTVPLSIVLGSKEQG